VTARQLAQLIGKLQAALQAILPASLFYWSLQGDLQKALNHSSQDYNTLLSLSPSAREELTWCWRGFHSGMAKLSFTKNSHNQVRCFPPGMGGSVQWHQDGRSLEPTRAGYAHQLPETSGSNPGSEDLLEGSGSNICTPTTGQPGSCGLHQQPGGTVSPQLTVLAKDLWMWPLSNSIILSAEHIPGVLNNIADAESRTITDRMDWKLHLSLFQQINQKWDPLEVDLFTSCLSTQLPHYFSWKLDHLAEAIDAFSQCWEHGDMRILLGV